MNGLCIILRGFRVSRLCNFVFRGLPNKASSYGVGATRVNKIVENETNLVLEGFKDYYCNLAKNLLGALYNVKLSFSITEAACFCFQKNHANYCEKH